jgi:hypothetical protein
VHVFHSSRIENLAAMSDQGIEWLEEESRLLWLGNCQLSGVIGIVERQTDHRVWFNGRQEYNIIYFMLVAGLVA